MKKRIGILFGGKSAEHEVSIRSAINVASALDLERFEPVPIYIDKQGEWLYVPTVESVLESTYESKNVSLSLGTSKSGDSLEADLLNHVDVIFPVLHGPLGEDGSVQGLFNLIEVPFVGPGILSSAVGMDKDVAKRLLRDSGITVARFRVISATEFASTNAEEIVQELGLPMFVKPANMGSSVGVSKVDTLEAFNSAAKEALRFDTKIVIEEAIVGAEIECAVLGNETPKASVIGKIVPQTDDFYSYDAKYIDMGGATLELPALISEEATKNAQELAIKVYKVLGCEGMTRVDMFLRDDNTIVVNEINTIPGFTNISMYPKLWEASGVSYTELTTTLIDLAIERFEVRRNLETSYETTEV